MLRHTGYTTIYRRQLSAALMAVLFARVASDRVVVREHAKPIRLHMRFT